MRKTKPKTSTDPRIATLLAPVLLGLAAVPPAGAGLITWTAAADGTSFGNSGNWSPATVPGAADHVMFDPLGGLITFGMDRSSSAMTVDRSQVTLQLDGHTFGAGEVTVGESGAGTLLVADGFLVSDLAARVGDGPQATGVVMLGDPGASWTCNERLVVGNFGDGSVAVTGGGTFTTSRVTIADEVGSAGAVTVHGPASAWNDAEQIKIGDLSTGSVVASGGSSVSSPRLILGDFGTGTATIKTGSSLSVTGGLLVSSIGDEVGSTGTLTVKSAGSSATFASLELQIGKLGTGKLRLLSGGAATTPNTAVGDDPGSSGQVTVQGSGSTWTVDGELLLGDAGAGSLTVTSGGTASCLGLARIGDELGATGAVTVEGGGSRWTCAQELVVGNFGTGSVSVADGGSLTTTRTKLGDEIGAEGTVTVDGADSSWQDSLEIFVGNFGTGTLAVTGGAAVVAPRCTVGDDPGSRGEVSLVGSGSSLQCTVGLEVGDLGDGTVVVDGGATVQAGSLQIGKGFGADGHVRVRGNGSTVAITASIQNGMDGVGELRLINTGSASCQGTYAQGGLGTLSVVLGPQSNDLLTVVGPAVLAGELDVTLAGGFTPTPGSSFRIMTAGAISGAFATVGLPAGMQIEYEPGAVRIVTDGAATPVEAVPTSFSETRGTVVSGTLGSLLDSDNDRLRIRSELHGTSYRTDTRINCSGPATASRLDLTVETGVNVSGVRTFVYLRNFATSSWDRLERFDQPTGDTVRQYDDVANPGDYVNGTGRVKVRILTKTPVGSYVMRIDHVEVTVTP